MSDLPHVYRPPWAAHVEGRYSERDEDGEQKWSARCGRCGAEWPTSRCTSGMVKRKISWFAQDHAKCEEKKR